MDVGWIESKGGKVGGFDRVMSVSNLCDGAGGSTGVFGGSGAKGAAGTYPCPVKDGSNEELTLGEIDVDFIAQIRNVKPTIIIRLPVPIKVNGGISKKKS